MTTLHTVEILERLVAFPTVSREPNCPLIEWVRNYLLDQGIDSCLVPNETGTKANLFACIGPQEEGGLGLSGHTDVVPIDGQRWTSDPFKLTPRDSKLFGRGACDMKGFIAVALSKIPTWKGSTLRRPIYLMFSYDEEVGCLGAPKMIEAARKALPMPSAVIVGEPTGMRIATEHKGICTVRTRVSGIEAHSSLTHQGHSAVMLAGELIAHLGQMAGRRAKELRTCRFEPPYTTLGANSIEGGSATNILAAACEFGWDIRALPGESPQAVLDEFTAFARGRLDDLLAQGKPCLIDSKIEANVPPLRAEPGGAEAIVRHAAGLTGDSIAVPFATEAGQFQAAGWSTVVCGPGHIDQAHKPDEFIDRRELAACGSFLDAIVAKQCR